MTDETRRLLDKLDHNLNDVLFDLVDENETLEGQVNELREQVARLTRNKGEWTEWKGRNGRYKGIPICSNCHTGFPVYAKDYKFCPECGAKMKGCE